ncbi:MAG: D-amino acid aminotransferase [Comamonadaceae bacterium]|nr:MAG: D-amino acid aminotransferase [Comamonadaceae bacterium]
MSTSAPAPTVNPTLIPDTPCYLNGDFTPLRDAKISVLDRGFIFGDGIYEVVPAYGGRLFRFEQHMARLERSLAELRIANPLTRAQWREIAGRLIADGAAHTGVAAASGNQLVYIQVSRGVAMRDHPMLPGLAPTVFMMCNPLRLPGAQQRQDGVACVTADDFRWEKAHIKSTSLLGAVFSRQISVDAGAVETVMFRGDNLSEASSSNVWVVRDGRVFGPLKDRLVLEGIRYGLIEEICSAAGIPFELRPIHKAEVLDADELILSSATKEVLPVTLLDGQPVGHGLEKGKPGPIYERLYAAYQQATQA